MQGTYLKGNDVNPASLFCFYFSFRVFGLCRSEHPSPVKLVHVRRSNFTNNTVSQGLLTPFSSFLFRECVCARVSVCVCTSVRQNFFIVVCAGHTQDFFGDNTTLSQTLSNFVQPSMQCVPFHVCLLSLCFSQALLVFLINLVRFFLAVHSLTPLGQKKLVFK